jgi:hypothetical protein
MSTKEKYCDEVRNQIAKGVDFEKGVFEISLSLKSELADVAKKYHYKRSKTAYCGVGGSFYLLLQRVYNQMRKEGEI